MNSPDWASIVGALGVGSVLSAVVMYFTSRRQRSGRVGTSESTELWAENRTLRQDLYAQNANLRAENDKLRAENLTQQSQIIELRVEIAQYKQALKALEERNE